MLFSHRHENVYIFSICIGKTCFFLEITFAWVSVDVCVYVCLTCLDVIFIYVKSASHEPFYMDHIVFFCFAWEWSHSSVKSSSHFSSYIHIYYVCTRVRPKVTFLWPKLNVLSDKNVKIRQKPKLTPNVFYGLLIFSKTTHREIICLNSVSHKSELFFKVYG